LRLKNRGECRDEIADGQGTLWKTPCGGCSTIELLPQSFARTVWPLDPLKFGEEFIRQVGTSPMLAPAGIPARALDDNFVHIWSHNVIFQGLVIALD